MTRNRLVGGKPGTNSSLLCGLADSHSVMEGWKEAGPGKETSPFCKKSKEHFPSTLPAPGR